MCGVWCACGVLVVCACGAVGVLNPKDLNPKDPNPEPLNPKDPKT